ncbi:hypothetical protein MNB_SV-13-251 [hydrothermal vent metagenome]|uniref:Uncharacterized protein n=1 Tax=hydrothermal vent metagenome TaxID=652676 RepID=A0A1W1D1I5_9ZZZZ
MSMRVLIIGYVLIEYLGEKPIEYRGKVPVGSRKYMKVKKGDIVVADEVTAITYCRGTQWKRVEHNDVDIASLFVVSEQKEPIKEDELIDEDEDELIDKKKSIKKMTQSNLDDFSIEELIAFAKSKKVTGVNVRSTRAKVIPLILPFLPTE